jgi:hypothetical protein
MKKALFFLGAVLAVGSVSAQQRLILGESFSQASCPPCAAQNPAYQTLMDANTSKIVTVKYQTSWPGVDPMNAQNPTEIQARVDYYAISGVPDRIMDGTNMGITQAAIDSRYAVPSPITLTVTNVVANDFGTVDVTVTINAPAVWNPTNTVMQLALVEKEISFDTPPGSNGETVFHNVMRKMIPNAAGSVVNAANFASPGGSQTFTFTNVVVPSYIYKLEEMAFIAWVQNNTTKEIHQAGWSAAALANYAVVSDLNVEEFSCATSVSPVAVLENTGTTPITSATVHYQIDGGAVQTSPFTGNIAVGATYNFNIPTQTVASGAHTLTSYLSNINGSGSSNPVGEKEQAFATVSAAGSVGPFVQNFSSTSFPYANYVVTQWTRNAANSGSAKMDFFNLPVGAQGEMTIAPIDMTSISNPTMTFDVAHRMYDANFGADDKLEVYVSTDCGANWTSVYNKQGSTLATLPNSTSGFTPAAASDWRNESVSLSSYATSNKLFVKFVGTSGFGNNLYVDNINIQSLSIDEAVVEGMEIYPNPASDVVNVKFDAKGGNYYVAITDLAGRTVATQTVENAEGSQTVAVPVAGLAGGNYIVTIKTDGAVSTQKVVIK